MENQCQALCLRAPWPEESKRAAIYFIYAEGLTSTFEKFWARSFLSYAI